MKDPDRMRRAAVRVTRYMNPDKKRDRPMTMTDTNPISERVFDINAYKVVDDYLTAVDPRHELPSDSQIARYWDGSEYAVLTIGAIRRLHRMAEEVLTAPEPTPIIPGARRGDPATSHLSAAEAALHADKGRGRILMTFVRAERIGITSMTSEGVVAMADMGHQKSPWKRVSDLKTAGLIESTGETHRGMTGRDAELLRLTEAGRKRAKEQMPDAWAAIVGDS